MEDYIYQIHKYLPIKFNDEESNDFLKYLEDTYLDNIKNGKYQFAFNAFHMLYMTCLYKFSWFLKNINNEPLEEKTYTLKFSKDGQGNIQKNNLLVKKLFDYSFLSEGDVVEKIFKKTDFHPNDLEKCMHHVEARNHCSHASGKIEYDEKGINFLVSDELKYIERLQSKIKPDYKKFLENFLINNWDKSLIESDLSNFFAENYISLMDLELLTSIELTLFRKKSNNYINIFQKILYLVFLNEAQKYNNSDKNIFLEKLPMFMIGAEKEIKINEEGKKVLFEEIVEEYLIPIISKFNEKEMKEAEKILGL